MTDTQWPSYEAFIKSKANQPHRNAGSVHAVDPEMALQNARDVFVRRPNCLSLWVAPSEAIMAWTDADLSPSPPWDNPITGHGEIQTYQLFIKRSQRQSMTYVEHAGHVSATCPELALKESVKQYADQPVYVWWIVPESEIYRSEEDDLESMFGPALNKDYRMPREYRVLSEMLEAKSRREEDRQSP